jgi:hypothetical protein
MSAKPLSIISAVLTVIFVILLGIAFIFVTMVALNGYGSREGDAALTITLICQGVGLLLSAILAGTMLGGGLRFPRWSFRSLASMLWQAR